MTRTILFLIMLILLISSVQAIPQGAITINSPSTDAWTNELNFTSGFNFSWVDNEHNYNASCSLWIGEDNNLNIINTNINNSYGIVNTNQSENTIISMNHSFVSNNTQYYWAIKCANTTYPPTVASDLRILKQDVTFPKLNISDIGFTNNTWLSSNSLRFEITAEDDQTLGESITVYVQNSTGSGILETTTVTNGTKTNITWTAPDGNFTVKINASDPATNSNKSNNKYVVKIDTTSPVVTWNTPADDVVITINSTLLNWTLTELNLQVIILNFNGSDTTIGNGNCTGGPSIYNCTYNKTNLVNQKDIIYYLTINDSASNSVTTDNRTLSYDDTTPSFAVFNWSVSSSTASWRILVTDTTPTECFAKLYDRDNTLVTTSTGTFGTVGATTNCTGSFVPSDIIKEGTFRVEYNVTDSDGNSLTANKSGVLRNTYAGWNLVTYSDSNRTVYTICTEIEDCTQVSRFNNADNNFTTYSTSTPGTNNATEITEGDAILIYVSSNSSMLNNDQLPTVGDSDENITLYDQGWNTMGLILNSNISAVYNAITHGTTADKNISWASDYSANLTTFRTCSRSAALCAGTTLDATDINLLKGYAVWVLTDLAGNYTINRSGVSSG